MFWKVSKSLQENTCARVSFLTKIAGSSLQLYLKKDWHRCFPVSLAKFLISPCFKEHLRWLLLNWISLTLKKLGNAGQFDPIPLWFFQNVFSRESVKPCFFLTFNIIISYIFPETFYEIPHIVEKIWRFSPPVLTIFTDFLGFFDISLLQRNECRQHKTDYVSIFNFNLL